MIWCLCPNPAVDKTVTVEGLGVGRVNRVTSVRTDAGGKGLNVARVVLSLGAAARAVAPVAGDAGRFLVRRLADEGVPCSWIQVSGETRTNFKIVDTVVGTHTDVNEPGPTLTPDDLDRFEALWVPQLTPGDAVVCSGSLPPGVPAQVYGRWVGLARARGAWTLVDADGDALALALAAGPDWVKPNRTELERWAGRSLETDADLGAAVGDLRAAGARSVALSLGADGAWVVTPEGRWRAPALAVDVKSTVGAGDALVAGLTVHRDLGEPGVALAWGLAAATASLVQPGTGPGRVADVARFQPLVQVRRF